MSTLIAVKKEKFMQQQQPPPLIDHHHHNNNGLFNLEKEIDQLKQKKKRRKYIENMIPVNWELGSNKNFYTETKKTDVSDSDTSDKDQSKGERGGSNNHRKKKKSSDAHKKKSNGNCKRKSKKRIKLEEGGNQSTSQDINSSSGTPLESIIPTADTLESSMLMEDDIGQNVKNSFYFIEKVNEELDAKNQKYDASVAAAAAAVAVETTSNNNNSSENLVSVITKIEAKTRKRSNKMESTFEQCTNSDIRPLEDWISNYYYTPNKTQQMISDDISNSITNEINSKISSESSSSSSPGYLPSLVEITESRNRIKKEKQSTSTDNSAIIDNNNNNDKKSTTQYKKPVSAQKRIDERRKLLQQQQQQQTNGDAPIITGTPSAPSIEIPTAVSSKKKLFYENDDTDQPFELTPTEYSIMLKLESEDLKNDKNYRDIGRNYINKVNLDPPDLPECTPSYCRKMMREPLGEQYGERNCANESKCMAMVMSVLYPDSLDGFVPEDAFIMMEFMFPEQLDKYKADNHLPAIRQDCILCNRHKTTLRHYMYQKRNEEPRELIQDHQNVVAIPPPPPTLSAMNNGAGSIGNNDTPLNKDAYNIDKCIYPETSPKQVFTGITRPIVKFSPNNYVYDTTKILVFNPCTGEKATTELKCMKEINMDFR